MEPWSHYIAQGNNVNKIEFITKKPGSTHIFFINVAIGFFPE